MNARTNVVLVMQGIAVAANAEPGPSAYLSISPVLSGKEYPYAAALRAEGFDVVVSPADPEVCAANREFHEQNPGAHRMAHFLGLAASCDALVVVPFQGDEDGALRVDAGTALLMYDAIGSGRDIYWLDPKAPGIGMRPFEGWSYDEWGEEVEQVFIPLTVAETEELLEAQSASQGSLY